MDLLSAVLRELRLASAAYFVMELDAPWRVRFDGGLRGVHVVEAGRCMLGVDGGEPQPLTSGDLVLLPRADSHELWSENGAHATPLSSFELAAGASGHRVTVPGPGARTRLLCGAFTMDDDHPAVRGFPHSIVVPGDAEVAPPWMKGLSTALAHEADDGGPGSEVVMARLSDALVTRALRHHLETSDDPGWLSGLRDPAVASAIAAVHAEPAAAWDLAGLARTAGLSRSAFAARFNQVVGQTPMRYVFEYRMRRAAQLRTARDGATVASVASAVGYGSEAAFAAAFVRYAGRPPGAYRRTPALLGESEPR
jgi:AraC-like DNA-binding protein